MILLTGVALLGCDRPTRSVAKPSCSALERHQLALQKQTLRHGVRAVSRARLERLHAGWQRVIHRCGKTPQAEGARLSLARLRESIARVSRQPEDLSLALAAYAALSQNHPKGVHAAHALWRRGALALDFGHTSQGLRLLQKLTKTYPQSGEARRAKRALVVLAPVNNAPPAKHSKKQKPRAVSQDYVGRAVDPDQLGIRFSTTRHASRLLRVLRWSTPAFSRVVTYFSRPVRYLHGLIPPEGTLPARLYVDYPSAQLGPRAHRADAAKGHLVHGLRLANRPPSSARLVMELSRPLSYQIYPLTQPYRVVVDLWTSGASPATKQGPRPAVRVVAIDPGHGGEENGAVGPSGLKEKDVTLAIAKVAAEALKKGGIKVVLTRDKDQSVTLEERTAIALAVGADLFVSIHANADPKGKQQGIETYYLDVSSDRYAARLAARENRSAGRAVSSYRLVLADLTTRANTNQSRRLATILQRSLLKGARTQRAKLPDRGVRKAIFYVLLTARVPGVLTEVSFISHPEGEAALRKPDYLQRLGRSIAQGILRYSKTR